VSAGRPGTQPDLQLHFGFVRNLGPPFSFWLSLGFPFDARCVLRACLPLCIVCGELLCGVVGAGLQGVQAGAPGVGLVLRRRRMHAGLGGFRSGNRKIIAGYLKGPVVAQRPGDRAGLGALVLRLRGPFRWPGLPAAIAAWRSRPVARSMALAVLGLSDAPVHEPVHGRGAYACSSCYCA